MSILEAMSTGLPVVASRVARNCETIIHGSSGYYYDLGDIQMASRYLQDLAFSFSKRSNFGVNSRAMQREYYSAQSMAEQYSGVYSVLQRDKV